MNIMFTDSFVETAVETISNHIKATLVDQKYFILGLSGGNTPRPIYKALAEVEGIDWNQVIITFGDERTVPPDHEDSNYKMAYDNLLSKIDIPDANVLRMKGELDPEVAAKHYEEELIEAADKLGVETFRHDLLLLGLGDDGHTASLFPGTKALHETDRLCVANVVPQQNTTRLTLTYPIINDAKHILFLVSGTNKSSVVSEVITNTNNHPASRIAPSEGQITWLLDWMPKNFKSA